MNRICIIHIAFALLCLIMQMACTSSEVREKLERAEKLATIAPDSALSILEDVRPDVTDDAESKSQFNVVWAEAYYMKHRMLTDSIDETLACSTTVPDTKHDIMKRILHAVYLFGNNEVEDAFSAFESCSRRMDGIAPYWKCVVEDYLGMIYLDAEMYKQARQHFYNVLKYSESMKDLKAIANANSHISSYYHMAGHLDSALCYATKVLSDDTCLDSQMLAIAYQNICCIQMAMADSLPTNNMDILQLYDNYRINTPDSMLTFALMSQAYILRQQFDSAHVYQRKVECGDHNNAKLVMYKFLSDYYQQQKAADSLLKYLKLYGRMDSLYVSPGSVESLLDTVYMHNQDDAEEQSAKQNLLIVVVSMVIIVVVVILLLVIHRRKMTAVYGEIKLQNRHIRLLDKRNKQLSDDLKVSCEESLTLRDKVSEQEKAIETAELAQNCLKKEMGNMQNTLQDTQLELMQTTEILSSANLMIERYRTIISKKNSKLVQTRRNLERSETNKKDQGNVVIQNFLDKSVCMPCKMNKSQMQYVIDSYVASGENRAKFIRSLMKSSKGLTPTGFVICILYHEGYVDEEIISKLNYEPKNFKMAKSRARTTLDTPNCDDLPIVKELLRRFDYKKCGK